MIKIFVPYNKITLHDLKVRSNLKINILVSIPLILKLYSLFIELNILIFFENIKNYF